jgi:hypothetical protein
MRFTCKFCGYSCRDNYNMQRHYASTKHQMVTNGNKNEGKTRDFKPTFNCFCGKSYKFRSGLSRHQKICSQKNVVLPVDKNESQILELCKTMKQLMEDNRKKTELMGKMLDQNSLLIPKVGNNNNKISINVFLNEKCKGAMNLHEFVDKVKVTLEDLNYTKDNGYVKGISNIFVKHLTDMEPTERPIHCSDKKRLQFYIKDKDTWKKDSEHKKINKSIQDVTMKQIKQLKLWEQQHPDYLTDDNLLCEWHQMIHKIMGGSNEEEREKNAENIKKGISSSVDMKNAMVVT